MTFSDLSSITHNRRTLKELILSGFFFSSQKRDFAKRATLKSTLSNDWSGVLSGADMQKSRSSDIVMLAGKYGILDKKLAGN